MVKPIWQRAKGLANGKSTDEQREIMRREFLGHKFFTNKGGPVVTSGPFRLSQWRADQSWTLVRNPNHWNNNPTGVDRVIYRYFRSTDVLQVAAIANQIDATSSGGLSASPSTVETLRTLGGNFGIYLPNAALWEHMEINVFAEEVPEVAALQLQDKRTRHALMYAMDRQTVASQLRAGTAKVTNNVVNSAASIYSDMGFKTYGYNPERAKQLPAELGWKVGSDNILERTHQGKTVKFILEYITTAGNSIRERDQLFYRENLRKVGIDVRIRNSPVSILFENEFIGEANKGKWKGIFQFANFQQPLTEDMGSFVCDDPSTLTPRDNLGIPENNYAGTNVGGWCNAEYDRLWDASRREFNPEKRKQHLVAMQKIWNEELPALPLYERTNLFIARRGLRNYTWNAASVYPSAYAWQIGWAQRGQKEIIAMK